MKNAFETTRIIPTHISHKKSHNCCTVFGGRKRSKLFVIFSFSFSFSTYFFQIFIFFFNFHFKNCLDHTSAGVFIEYCHFRRQRSESLAGCVKNHEATSFRIIHLVNYAEKRWLLARMKYRWNEKTKRKRGVKVRAAHCEARKSLRNFFSFPKNSKNIIIFKKHDFFWKRNKKFHASARSSNFTKNFVKFQLKPTQIRSSCFGCRKTLPKLFIAALDERHPPPSFFTHLLELGRDITSSGYYPSTATCQRERVCFSYPRTKHFCTLSFRDRRIPCYFSPSFHIFHKDYEIWSFFVFFWDFLSFFEFF